MLPCPSIRMNSANQRPQNRFQIVRVRGIGFLARVQEGEKKCTLCHPAIIINNKKRGGRERGDEGEVPKIWERVME